MVTRATVLQAADGLLLGRVANGHPPVDETFDGIEDGFVWPARPRCYIGDSDLLAGIAEAFAVRGKPFTYLAYLECVKSRGGVSRAGRRVAGYGTIQKRFRDMAGDRGPFKYVCNLAPPTGWDTP